MKFQKKLIAVNPESHSKLLKAKAEYIAIEGRNINFSDLIIKLCEETKNASDKSRTTKQQ